MEVPPSEVTQTFVDELRQWPGCRSVWLDPQGELWHTEPDMELERAGYQLLDTVETRDNRALEGLRTRIAGLVRVTSLCPEHGSDIEAGEHARLAEARVGV